MNLFGKKKIKILAPVDGRAVPIAETPDKVFSEKVLGDGVTMLPENGEIVAPVAGTVATIANTRHAVCIEGDEGAEVLIHLGIDTVKLGGKGFTCLVKAGEHVRAGQKLMDMDLDFIRGRGYNTASPCILTNPNQVKKLTFRTGDAEAGKTAVMEYEK
ncbi:MAG TPA: hypothetical protein DCL64_05080 [Ruminococcaceae bacterium]|jgi:glucose-specific phosphotransferase system IIA component|nr:hypothetical protein [Oscillospiraceae bacterium]HBG55626.1 hypothetical protein [Oscillospiraceae bacterium]HCB91419.1 hypothetical protein [Oscillospiraceae bacterium]